MSKFKVLKSNELILIQLGLLSNQFPKEPSDGLSQRLFRVGYLSFSTACFVTSATLFTYHNAAQFTLVLRVCEYLFASGQGAAMLICFSLNPSKIRTVHLKLQELIDQITMEGKWHVCKSQGCIRRTKNIRPSENIIYTFLRVTLKVMETTLMMPPLFTGSAN